MRTAGFEPGRAVASIPHCSLNCPLKKRPGDNLSRSNFFGKFRKNQKEEHKRLSLLKRLEILLLLQDGLSALEKWINISPNEKWKAKTHQPKLTTKQWSKFKGLVTQHVLLVHDLFRFAVLPAMREHHARLATNGGKSTHAAAKQLIATPRTHDLKVQRLIELTKFLWPETNTQCDRVIGGNDPAVIDELRGTGC